MRDFLRQAGYFILIMTLLPYVVTVFVSGNVVPAGMDAGGAYVMVQTKNKERQMPLNEYGIGVLAHEIDAESEAEAIKAQAVLIRTAIYKTIEEEGSKAKMKEHYWSRSQMQTNWGRAEYAEKYEKLKNAWEETGGQILMYDGKAALAPYHRLSNGRTRSAEEVFGSESYPYLKGKECAADLEAGDAMGTVLLPGSDMEVTKTDSAGYVTEVRCGKEQVDGEAFRDTYHLTSACFTLQAYENQIRAVTKGIGHGLGMSQYTAERMAKEGKSCAEILMYFFEGTTLETVADIVTKYE